MTHPQSGPAFRGSIPELYDRHLVPVLFESYARDLAGRVRDHGPSRVLEVAAGSGVATRAMADSTGADTAITATDLSQPMIDEAQAVGASRAVEWRQADIMALPFDDDASDVVVSQFGVMFLPDKGRGFAEVRRVLRPGGTFIFSVWDRLDNNGFSSAVQAGLEGYFPDDPPSFLPNAAFGYHEGSELRADLAASTLTWR